MKSIGNLLIWILGLISEVNCELIVSCNCLISDSTRQNSEFCRQQYKAKLFVSLFHKQITNQNHDLRIGKKIARDSNYLYVFNVLLRYV